MGRTRFLCSYTGCKTCSPNMRFNIERHVWTQHVRRTVPGMNQCNYVARLHKVYVHRYVIMADEAQQFFTFPDEQYHDSFLSQQPPTPHTISSFGRAANDSYFGVTCQPTSDGAVSDGQIAVLGSFEHLAGMLKNEDDQFPSRHSLACGPSPNERELPNENEHGFFLKKMKCENCNARTCVPELPSTPVTKISDYRWNHGPGSNGQSTAIRNARINGGNTDQSEFLNQYGLETCEAPPLFYSKKNGEYNETSSGLEPFFSVSVPRFPSSNQQSWRDHGQLEIQAGSAWPEFNYYLTLAGEQEAGSGDVWRPVNF